MMMKAAEDLLIYQKSAWKYFDTLAQKRTAVVVVVVVTFLVAIKHVRWLFTARLDYINWKNNPGRNRLGKTLCVPGIDGFGNSREEWEVHFNILKLRRLRWWWNKFPKITKLFVVTSRVNSKLSMNVMSAKSTRIGNVQNTLCREALASRFIVRPVAEFLDVVTQVLGIAENIDMFVSKFVKLLMAILRNSIYLSPALRWRCLLKLFWKSPV